MLCFREQTLKEKVGLKPIKEAINDPSELQEREITRHLSCLFFQYITQLHPPHHMLVDNNFINFPLKPNWT